MPVFAIVGVTIAVVGSAIFIAYQVRSLLRQRRNLVHWEKDEPLEGRGDWD